MHIKREVAAAGPAGRAAAGSSRCPKYVRVYIYIYIYIHTHTKYVYVTYTHILS